MIIIVATRISIVFTKIDMVKEYRANSVHSTVSKAYLICKYYLYLPKSNDIAVAPKPDFIPLTLERNLQNKKTPCVTEC